MLQNARGYHNSTCSKQSQITQALQRERRWRSQVIPNDGKEANKNVTTRDTKTTTKISTSFASGITLSAESWLMTK